MKKKYVLSTLVSLALGSGYALAVEDSAPSENTPVWTPPAVVQPSDQELTPPPIPETPPVPAASVPEFTPPTPPEFTPPQPPTTPVAIQPSDSAKSYQEMMEKRQVLWQEMQALREKISQTWDPEERQRLIEEFRQKMPQRGSNMPGGPYGYGMGPGPHSGFGGPMSGPQGPRYDMPPQFEGPRSFGPKGKKDCRHHTKMLDRLENIENLLKEVVELLKDKK